MLFILTHLGLGDAIIQQSLIRSLLLEHHPIILPVYHHNIPSVRHMYEDAHNVRFLCIKDESEMLDASRKYTGVILRLGFYSVSPFDRKIWDQEMYRQAGVPFSERWTSFKVPTVVKSPEIPQQPFDFVHDDLERGFLATRYSPRNGHLHYRPRGFDSIFDYIPVIEGAKSVHCIDSAFLCLVDSLPDNGQQLYFHKYARPDGLTPTLRRNWEVLE